MDYMIGFVGGLDLAYGRYDDDAFDLHADADGREAMNRYNGCIPQLAKLSKDDAVDPDLLRGTWDISSGNAEDVQKKIDEGAHQTPYNDDSPIWSKTGNAGRPSANRVGLDPSRQPRMPWQDMEVRIEGPAVSDLTRNFALRWNSDRASSAPKLPLPGAPDEYSKKGSCKVQVLRSAPAAMRVREAETNSLSKPSGAQDDILRAMRLLIEKAKNYIYIEQQFFVTDFGIEGVPIAKSAPSEAVGKIAGKGPLISRNLPGTGDSTASVHNDIGICLANRIGHAILAKEPFHVFIVLPVHPEGGGLNNPTVVTQIHWTQQSLTFGTHSLLNVVRSYIRLRALLDSKVVTETQVAAAVKSGVGAIVEFAKLVVGGSQVPIEACFEYVTLLNLRNWAKLGDRYVTEQIYIHTKMMIVDDRYALIGSANINDRSLLGSRDSELAVLVMDTAVQQKNICGDGADQPVRTFAHDLRKGVWRKIFGFSGNVRPADQLKNSIEQPASKKSWKAIQELALSNAKHYELAFNFIPRNYYYRNSNVSDPKLARSDIAASIWPTWDPAAESTPEPSTMPFDTNFWDKIRYSAEGAKTLHQIKGYITAYPYEWTAGEDNDMGYHTALMTQNGVDPSAVEASEASAVAVSNGGISNEESILAGNGANQRETQT